MKVTKIALATAFALVSTVALAQNQGGAPNTGTEGRGSVVAPSVGSSQKPVGSTNTPSTYQNTGPAGTSAQAPAATPPAGPGPAAAPTSAPTTGMAK